MADLLSIFAEAYPSDQNAFFRGAQGIQNIMSNSLDYQQKREALEAARGLRELYRQNPTPSYEDIARISPEFAMNQNKANFEMQKQLLDMQETQGKINKQQQEEVQFFANAVGPVVEQYLMNTGGDGNQQQQSMLKQQIGAGLNDIEQRTGKKPVNADALLNMSPSEMLHRLMLNGYQSPVFKGQAENQTAVQRESMLSGMPQRPSYSDVAGRTEAGPYGTRFIQPAPPPGYGVIPFNPNAGQRQGASQQPAPYSFQGPSGAQFDMYDLGSAAQAAAALPAGPDKDAALKYIDEQWSKMRSGQGGEIVQPGQVAQPPAGGFITPQQEMQMRIGEKAAEAGAVEAAKSAAGKREIAEQRSDVLSSLPSDEKLNQLIDESIASGAENILKGKIEPFIGQSSPALEATKQLEVIQPQLQSLTKALVGAGAVSDYEQRMMANAAASIANPEMPAEPRKAALKVFMDIVKSAMQKYPDLAARLSSQSSAPAQSTAPTKLKIGEVKDGYEYIGGNPKDQSSWKKVR